MARLLCPGDPFKEEFPEISDDDDYGFDWEFLKAMWIGLRNIRKNYKIVLGGGWDHLVDAQRILEMEMLCQDYPYQMIEELHG